MMIPYAQGMGFAIPINTVKKIAQEILENGRVSRRWIGISGVDVTPQLARRYNLQTESGFLVAEVVPRSPSDYAGLRNGDVVVGADGNEIKHTKDLLLAISKVVAGGSIKLDVNRMGRKGSLDVKPSDTQPLQQMDGR